MLVYTRETPADSAVLSAPRHAPNPQAVGRRRPGLRLNNNG